MMDLLQIIQTNQIKGKSCLKNLQKSADFLTCKYDKYEKIENKKKKYILQDYLIDANNK